MALAVGIRLGVYEIEFLLGAGGMGEVYRARDTRLERSVAIKIPHPSIEPTLERLARFEREARTLAALTHPNIATIYGFEETDGIQLLVMELVEGPTLAEYIDDTPMRLDQALSVASQIVEALAAAHEQGIIHRDLKPANVKVKADGTVKVLDFGLAKVLTSDAPFAALSHASTVTAQGTRDGVLLGTPAYMSPEQIRGKPVDKRADIWAFGCVLFAMLSRRHPFPGETGSDRMAAILEREPDWAALPLTTPTSLRRLLRRCLEKDVKKRLLDIGDARAEIEEARETTAALMVAPRPLRRLGNALGVITLALLATTIGFAIRILRDDTPMPSLHFDVFLPDGVRYGGPAQISPDGRMLALPGAVDGMRRIWIRSLDSATSQPLSGTEGAYNPFWSPDSRSIGYFAAGKLKTIDATGGPSSVLCDITHPPVEYIGTWSAQGVILFGSWPQGELLQISARGGQAAPERNANGEEGRLFPDFLPDGQHYLYVTQHDRVAYVGRLGSQERRALPGVASQVKYSPSGHLIFLKDKALVARPFDVDRLEVSGEAFTLVDSFAPPEFVGAGFSVSMNGTLAYSVQDWGDSQLAWFDRRGRQLAFVGPLGEYRTPELSADSRYLAFTRGGIVGDVWVMDVETGAASRITFHEARDADPVWSPDGRTIAFGSDRGEGTGFYTRVVGSVGEEKLLLKGESLFRGRTLTDWSDDGRYVLYLQSAPGTALNANEIWALPLTRDGKPRQLTSTPFQKSDAQFSPDGRWVAYLSNETGQSEVYIQSFASAPTKHQVSTTGGGTPRWSRDGKELFYLDRELTLMAVSVKANATSLHVSSPTPLFQRPSGRDDYSVGIDGRFLMDVMAAKPVTVVTNWAASSRR